MKMKHILGTVTIVAIVGGTIYAIKKSKDMQKAEAQEITLEEAKEIVAEKEFDKAYYKQFDDVVHFTVGVKPLDEEEMDILKDGVREAASFTRSNMMDEKYFGEDFDEAVDEAREMAEYNRSFMPPNYDEEELDTDNIEGPSIDDNDIGTFTEEDRKLRYEPSSMDALKQFKRMELAELVHNSDVYQTMLRLYDFPFEPTNDGDDMLRTQIIDYRVQFFGFGSKWAQKVTFADVVMHYARNAQFNCDETVAYWVEYFLDFNDLWYQYSSASIDATINTLNAHQYFNDERQTFGLFGLTRNAMDQAIKIANRNIDRSVTYEIEFQEFLKSLL